MDGKLVRRLVVLVCALLAAASLFAPFVSRSFSDGAPDETYSAMTLLRSGDSVSRETAEGEVKNLRKKLADADGRARADYSYLYALLAVCAAVALGGAVLGWRSRAVYGISLAAALAGVASGAAVLLLSPGTWFLPEEYALSVADSAAWGAYACLASFLLLLAGAAFGLARERGAGGAVSAPRIARVGVLAAIAAVLYYIPGIPIVPPIYKLDFSGVPVLLAGFSMGPVAALCTLLIKDLTGLMHSSSMGVGELADFVALGAMALAASGVYKRNRTFKGALFGMLVGVLVMTFAGALLNYFVMIPFYVQVMNMPLEAILSLVSATVPAVDSLWKLILLAAAPFNLVKGLALCAVTLILYKRLSPILK